MSATEDTKTKAFSSTQNMTSASKPPASSKPSDFILDRRAMEEERLARLGKRKREPSPEPVLFNPGEGSLDAWQLGESVDDFVRRLPPLTTSVFTCAWIWAHNPHRGAHNGELSHRGDEFRSRGMDLLDQSLRSRQQIQTKGTYGPKAALTKSLNQASKALQQRITDLAVECGILSGKVSLKLFAILCAMLTAISGCYSPDWRKLRRSGKEWLRA